MDEGNVPPPEGEAEAPAAPRKKSHTFLILLALILGGGAVWTLIPPTFPPNTNPPPSTGTCARSEDCDEDEFCRFGLCAAFTVSTECEADTDCMLTDPAARYDCANESFADASSTPVAVNSEWFARGRKDFCAAPEERTGKPAADYHAVCAEKLCVAVPGPAPRKK